MFFSFRPNQSSQLLKIDRSFSVRARAHACVCIYFNPHEFIHINFPYRIRLMINDKAHISLDSVMFFYFLFLNATTQQLWSDWLKCADSKRNGFIFFYMLNVFCAHCKIVLIYRPTVDNESLTFTVRMQQLVKITNGVEQFSF